MIGLEYIAKTFKVQFVTVAESLGVSKKTVSGWIKGRRKIPKERLMQLSMFFNLPEEFFQKRLNDVETLEVQKASLKFHVKEFESDENYTLIDSFWEEEEQFFERIRNLREDYYSKASLEKVVSMLGDKRDKNLIALLLESFNDPGYGEISYGGGKTLEDNKFKQEFTELLLKYGFLEEEE